MSFLVYQRADPRFTDWLPLSTQQVRLRNLIQVIGVNLRVCDSDSVYFTLHLSPKVLPFYSSEKVECGSVACWKEIEPGRISSNVPLSAEGFVIRVWSASNDERPTTSWGVYLRGLHYLGTKGEWNSQNFAPDTLIFRMPYGFFTAKSCLLKTPRELEIFSSYSFIKQPESMRNSYAVKTLATLHDVQRSVLEELELSRKLRLRISTHGYSSSVGGKGVASLSNGPVTTVGNGAVPSVASQPLSGRALLRYQEGELKLGLKEQIESLRLMVGCLKNEKARYEGRVLRLKQRAKSCDDSVSDLMTSIHSLGRERERLKDIRATIQEKMRRLAESRSALNLRKKQLISELLVIYPLQLVEGSKRYSIAEVQLPNAEDYGNETGGQVSVALGYTAHLVAMLCFFLGIPPRYPILHFGSRSRIIDHITTQIPNKEREFPLYFRGREDVYSKYAVYLLNKNIAQLRWYCGLSTPDLRATLPNLYNVLTSRLIIPGWPPSPSESCEVAEELTEETHHQIFRNDLSRSLDGGLDQISTMPKLSDKERMQSWLSASYSDLDAAGSNAVPAGELHHSRGQNRFLSYWKKKTYSESEDIDPEWLTNSLNLELDLGSGRFPNVTSPPVRLPVISPTEVFESSNHRKRRFGRVEPHSLENSLETSGTNAASNLLRVPDPTHPCTPNRSMNDVEQRIIAFERRKSFCDPARIGITKSSMVSFENAPTETNVPSDVPLVDNYPTTDDEKLDSTIADVVRRLTVVQSVPVYSPVRILSVPGCEETTEGNTGANRDLNTIRESETQSGSGGKLPEVTCDGRGPPFTQELYRACDDQSNKSATHFDTESTEASSGAKEPPADSNCNHRKESVPIVNIIPAEAEEDGIFSTDEICTSNITPASHKLLGDDERTDLGRSMRAETEPSDQTPEKQDVKDASREVTCSINCVEDDSIWLRTEALLNSTPFNRVKRRMSESN